MDPAEEPTPPMALRWSAVTDTGRFRKNNEDSFLALTFDARELRLLGKFGEASLESGDFVFAVSDGMGGANSGEFASKIAVDKITRLLPASYGMAAQHLARGFGDVLGELFSRIHEEMSNLGRYYEECAGMGATLSLGWLMPGYLCFCHIGDSRIYYLPQDGDLTQVTHDHTHVGWLHRQGRLNERQTRSHPMRNALSKALGAGQQGVEPQVGRVRCSSGDRFLICSDGLVEGLWDRRIAEMLAGDLDARLMVEEAVAESGRDNTTAVMIEVR